MDRHSLLDAVRADGVSLVDAAHRAGWDSPVPGLTWAVRDLLTHVGAVHRWSADIVRRQLQANETGGSAAFHPHLPDRDLTGWYTQGLEALLTTLADAPEDLEAWTFAPGLNPRHFWCRRQAHETAVHRIDAEAAAGDVTTVGAAFAQDGLDELLTGFATEPAFAPTTPGTLGLLATDGDPWLVEFGGPRIVARRDSTAARADAVVTGTSSDLYRWAWNRPSPAVLRGDDAIASLWRGVRIT